MDDLNVAAQMLGVDAKFLQPFDITDPFNDELRLEGFLCQRPDHRYGALALLRVGNESAPQMIYATPKLHYPFGKDGRFHFPPIRRATIYEKLDGTNVLAYHYRDAGGRVRLTYKLRLAPVLRNSKWGALRTEMESRNRPAADEKLSGTEGAVWYVTEPGGRVTLWKCKPESVEEIHWATGINKAAVIATCWNALETSDTLNYDTLLPLLLEEYQSDDIEKFRVNIDTAIAEVNREFAFRQRVWAAYASLRAKGLSLRADKGGVMRALSAQFQRDEMKRVFSALARKEGLG